MSEIWFILLDGFDLFEASAAMHVFTLANEVLRIAKQSSAYKVRTFANGAAPVRSNGEVALNACELPRDLEHSLDRLILVGGNNTAQVLHRLSACQKYLVAWISRHRSRIGRLASIGPAAFVVVQSVLGTSHESVQHDRMGAPASTSGIELALRVIAHDAGHRIAMQVAQQLTPTPERFGAPFRFRSSLTGGACGDERVLALNRWIALHLREPLTNDQLARRLLMTPRTLSRFYQRATGFTPARAVEQIRIEHACHAVETTLMSFKEIAHRSGFSSEEVMRRAFLRVIEMSPSQYRQLFYGKV